MVPHQKQKQHAPQQLVNDYGWDAQFAVPDLRINPYESFASDCSRHGVLLGQIAGSQVVVKPHPNRDKAQRELKNIIEFNKVGLNTFDPIGVYEGRSASYLVTNKYEGLTPLNKLRLRVAHNERSAREEISKRVARSAVSAAVMHNLDATHGDFKTKNNFEGPRQEVVFGDLENAIVGKRGKGDSNRRAADVYELGASLMNSGYLYNRSPSYRSGAVGEIIIGPYIDALDNKHQTNIDLVEAAIDYTIRNNRIEPFGRFVNAVIKL